MPNDPRPDGRPGPLVDPRTAADGNLRRARQIRVELTGPLGCLAGSLLLGLAAVVLVVVAVFGVIALSLAVWLAAVLVALGAVSALLGRRRR